MADPEHPTAAGEVDKPAMTVGGRRMVDIAVDAVSVCRRTVLVGPTRTGVPEHVVQTREAPAGGGPVAALAAGLRSLDDCADSEGTADLVVVVASDLPFLDAAAVELLIGSISHPQTEAVFAHDSAGRTQFLLGIWRQSALRSALAQLDSVEGAPMRTILPPDHLVIAVSGVEDCDTPADLLAARLATRPSETLEVSDALERIRSRLSVLPIRRIPLPDSVGTVLAEPLVTQTALPAVDISAMDGYAVCGTEPWTLRSDIAYAGSSDIARLTEGTAVRIATGAALPPGATSVVRDEHMTREPDGSA
ncbi:MAG: NTP transferase domain-containing protein, partial [Rhodococcus sp. (in: high G+C Gram-positive bacteria)]